MSDDKKQIVQWENLKTLYNYRDHKGYGYEIRIGFWILAGVPQEPILVKQEFQITDSGFQKWGKSRGLSSGDMYRIFQNAFEISKIMEFPLPVDMKAMATHDGDPPAEQLDLIGGTD